MEWATAIVGFVAFGIKENVTVIFLAKNSSFSTEILSPAWLIHMKAVCIRNNLDKFQNFALCDLIREQENSVCIKIQQVESIMAMALILTFCRSFMVKHPKCPFVQHFAPNPFATSLFVQKRISQIQTTMAHSNRNKNFNEISNFTISNMSRTLH